MPTTQFGVLWILLLCCCHKSEAKLVLKHRTRLALAGESVTNMIEVTIPANSTGHLIKCFHKSHQVWEHPTDYKASVFPQKKDLSVNITMHNSSCSGEYYFEYMNEKVYWIVRVQDMGYQPHTKILVIPMLAVISVLLLLLSIIGSVYICMWYKNHFPSEGDEDNMKAKEKKRNTVATEGATSDSVYTALENRTASVYEVLNVEEATRASAKSQTSKKKAKPSPVEEGVFESVYENL
ncbi:hypothetical protein Q7C36_021978 [Tachysurus vachellii]|uniref:Uncharacterized protein n=1 Tax=Tachysurus vachellii TaxID=175792 RepID=A0AA88IJZ2_TACVA|nr:uncharacterized protein si:ch211-243a20.4 [Tachysurus vachellii]KAK2818045.1 hypothetical protein Q7C36_021978 [Tachysurus vachellii]